MMLILMMFAAAMSGNALIVEAESFHTVSGWRAGNERAEFAPGGLSGGSALIANEASAIARKTVTLPDERFHVWVRLFDKESESNHYAATAAVNGEGHVVGTSEPLYPTFVWEPLGKVDGGDVTLALSRPDGWASVVDCFLFTGEEGEPDSGRPGLALLHHTLSGNTPEHGRPLEVAVKPAERLGMTGEVTVALRRRSESPLDTTVVWRKTIALEPQMEGAAGVELRFPPISMDEMAEFWQWLPTGQYDVLLAVPHTAWEKGHVLTTYTKEGNVMPTPCKAEVRSYQGAPAIFVNGEPQFAFTYLVHTGEKPRYYGQMAEAGLRFFSVGGPLGNTPEGFDPEACDAPFLEVLDQQPEALVFPRVGVTAPQWWLDAHPDERVVFDDGSTGPQSMFSKKWLDAACNWIEDYARHIRTGPYADHVLGIHICSGTTAEWQSWGLWDNQRGDFSRPALDAWRAYLRDKYASDAALSEAWGRQVSQDSVEVPSRARREEATDLLRDPVAYRDVADFYDYYWRGTAHAITSLAAAAKRAGGRDWLVGFFYGYAIQYGGKMQESQHLGMKEVMDCPDIDFFCSPAMYSNRGPGGTSTFMSFTESIKNRGKMWWDEADNRTHLSLGRPMGTVAPAQNLWETLNVLEREYAHNMVRSTSLWWFDMDGGWYDDPAIMDLIAQMRRYGETSLKTAGKWRPETEIAVFVDDKSSYRMPPECGYLHAIPQLMSLMPRLGAPYHTYVLSDIVSAPDYKVYIFPLANDLARSEREAINALKGEGRTLVFMGEAGIGAYEEGSGVVRSDPALSDALIETPGRDEGIQSADHGTWRSLWCPAPDVTIADLRGALTQKGSWAPVHFYSREDDALYAGNEFLAVHAQTEGTKEIVFPEPVHIRELFAENALEKEAALLSFEMKAKETRCFEVEPANTKGQ
jgi:hypothetical protein